MIRKPSRDEWPYVLQVLSRNLRSDSTWPLWEEYPTILSLSNYAHSMVAWDGTRPISHAAFYPYSIYTQAGHLPVVAVGQVWTDPGARGQGWATKVLLALEEEIKKVGAAFAILWTGEPTIYEKIGYVRAGREVDWLCDRSELPAQLEHALKSGPVATELPLSARKSALSSIIRLYERHKLRVVRSPEQWEAYSRIPNSVWYVARSGDAITAYAVMGKGIDLGNAVHEWGGESLGVLCLLRHIIQSTSGRVMLMGPEDESEEVLSRLPGLVPHPVKGIVGYAKNISMPAARFEELVTTTQSKFYLWGFDSV